jgi:hypothetical protein
MHPFADLSTVHETLSRLIERELVMCLDRRPGQKEDRYTQLLEDQDAHADIDGATLARPASSPEISSSRPYAAVQPVDGLEERVARLEREVAVLRAGEVAQAGTESDVASTDTAGTSSHDPPGREWQ